MTLGRALIDRAGERHAMAGLLPVETSFAEPRLHLGYRHLKLLEPSPLGQAGADLPRPRVPLRKPGPGERRAAAVRSHRRPRQPLGELGARSGTVAGSFLHLIDRVTEPGDGVIRPSHVRLIEE